MMALLLRVLRYRSVMQSETRSLRAIWSRVKSGTGSPWATWSAQPWRLFWTGSKQAQRGGALGERQWRSTVDMSARRELLERIENESKAYGRDFGSQNLPTWQECATAVRSLCSQYELLSFSLCHYCASTLTWQECATAVTLIVLSIGVSVLFIAHAIVALPLRFVGLFALILRRHCAATETVALMIHFKVLFRCFQLLHNAFMLRFHFRLTFSNPLHCSCQSADPLRLF